jgi:hypothetical protein
MDTRYRHFPGSSSCSLLSFRLIMTEGHKTPDLANTAWFKADPQRVGNECLRRKNDRIFLAGD